MPDDAAQIPSEGRPDEHGKVNNEHGKVNDEHGKERTAAIAVPTPVRQLYHYAVPDDMHHSAVVGARVRVRFGPRTMVGYVVERDTPGPEGISLRPLQAVLDPHRPTFTPEMVAFVRWMADYYHQNLGEALRGAHPAGTNLTARAALRITDAGRQAVAAGEGDRGLLTLARAEGPLPTDALDAPQSAVRRWIDAGYAARTEIVIGPATKVKTVSAWRAVAPPPADPRGPGGKPLKRDVIHAWLVGRGAVQIAEVEAEHAPARSHLNRLVDEGGVVVEQVEQIRDPFFGEAAPRDRARALNAGQRRAVEAIVAAEGFHGFLLHGITGSGKTEVYLQAIERVLARGQGALVLVPEIALTPQLVRRFRARLGDELAVLHSGLGDGARYDQWRRLRRGDVKLAIGARSAIFAPVADLGLIVVDEEHDPSFKQHDGLRYNGRDMALVRGSRAGCPVVLGTATPSLESEHNVQVGKLERLVLTERPTGGTLPKVEVIDLNTTPRPEDEIDFLSLPLRAAIAETLAREEQAIVFLNRRGFSTFAQCTRCGEAVQCDNCAISLTWHKRRRQLRCHYCDAARPLPERCPSCDHREIRLPGRGTERVEEDISALFPHARVARLDRDTANPRRMEEVLAAMRTRQMDILVGTQMVTKGHDFPYVTLVGVLDADAGLHFPDFRATERTFQLLAQVAGRAGRGERAGRVLIQTRNPQHVCLQAAVGHDHARFAAHALAERREHGWPPHTRAVILRFEGRDPDRVAELARRVERVLRRAGTDGAVVRGPAPAVLEKLRGRTRWMLMLTARSRRPLRRLLDAIDRSNLPRAGDPRLIVDVDPQDMM